ncbi:MAG: hypothetical protein QF886_22075, partial [Planctomycetota bacterium]|nr:hypothetical protein [Planctomycetota bacterium]
MSASGQRISRRILDFIFLISASSTLQLSIAEQTFELLTNSSIEELSPAGTPVGWSTGTLRKGKGEWAVDEHVAKSGKRSL